MEVGKVSGHSAVYQQLKGGMFVDERAIRPPTSNPAAIEGCQTYTDSSALRNVGVFKHRSSMRISLRLL